MLNSKKSGKKLIAVILVSLVVVFSLQKIMTPSHNAPQFPPPSVQIMEIAPQDVELDFSYTGRVAGYREVDVRAQVTGVLEKILYHEGALIKKGEPIFVVDPVSFEQNVRKAKSTLHDAEQNLQYAKNLRTRINALYEREAVSKDEYDRAATQYQNALANFDKATADLKIARTNLSYAEITAPITGIIGAHQYSEGNLINAGSPYPLAKIVQTDPIYVNFAYNDSDMMLLRSLKRNKTIEQDDELRVDVILEGGEAAGLDGHVDFIDSKIDHETATVEARAVLSNPEGTLLPGEFVKISVRGIRWKDAVAVPDGAVIQTAQGAVVYVINSEDVAEIRPVGVGPLTLQGRIITSGLEAGDRVAIDGIIKVRPGGKVMIQQQGAPGEKVTGTVKHDKKGSAADDAAAAKGKKPHAEKED